MSTDWDGVVRADQFMYLKKIDADNDGVFIKIKVNGVDTEIQVWPHTH